MRKTGKSTLTTISLAATAVIAAGAATLTAAWTILPGGAVTATNTQPITGIDLNTGASVVCDVSTAKATMKSGSGIDGIGMASIDEMSFSTPGNPNDWCIGPVGIVVQITPTNLPWKVNAESYDVSEGQAKGRATGVAFKFHGSDECDAVFSGANGEPGWVRLTYDNESGKGVIGEPGSTDPTSTTNLVVTSKDADCDPTLIEVGDPIVLDGEYAVDPKQSLTSP